MINRPPPSPEHPVCQFVGTPSPFIWSETGELVRLGVPMTLLAIFSTDINDGSGYFRVPTFNDPAGRPVPTRDLFAGLPSSKAWRALRVAAEASGLAIKHLLARPGRLWECWRMTGRLREFCHALRAHRRISDWQPAMAYIHFAFSGAKILAGAAVLGGIPFLVVTHANDIYAVTPDHRAFLARVLKRCLKLLTVSDYNVKVLSEMLDGELVRSKTYVRRMGVDPEDFASPAPADLNARPLRMVIVPSGFMPKKGLTYLVQAAGKLVREGLDLRLTVIGGTLFPERVERARQQVREAGIEERTEFTGQIPPAQVREHVLAAPLFVLPCIVDDEGKADCIPVALMEAMALRRLVISTPVAGIPELISDQHNGLLVPSKDVDALAAAIRKAYEDPARYTTLPERARETICQHYHLGKNARQMAEHLGCTLA